MRYWRDESGAALIYVSLLMVALVGLTGLALDSGRIFTLKQELQKAADAAALAGAWWLDGTQPGSQNADIAARTSLIPVNSQKFGSSPGAITIASTNFWSAVPADDDTPLAAAAPPYDYIEVTTSATAFNPLLARVLGAAPTINLTATAVARKGAAVCQVTPLAICNPNEDPALGGVGASFDPTVWYGKQIRIRQHGQSAQWAPGEFGLLDTPAFQQGTKAIAESIAEGNGNACYSTEVDPKPGQANAANNAFNTRFDIYENPFFGGNAKNDSRYAPAENVTKGFDTSGQVNQYCNNPAVAVSPAQAVSQPRDSSLSPTNRFGNGVWDCADYWTIAHPNDAPPANCNNPVTNGWTRYNLYRYEIDNNLIPQPDAPTNYVEDGDPLCHAGTKPSPWTPTTLETLHLDRRILTFAVLNCVEYCITGNTNCANLPSGDVPVESFLNGFMTEPIITGSQEELYLEVVGSSNAGSGGIVPVVLRDWVELVR